jgi:phage repressor protein C with HTH and peptisase S24 domain
MPTLAENLTRIMSEQRISNRALAEKAGCSHVIIGHIKAGKVHNTSHISALAKALGVNASDLDESLAPNRRLKTDVLQKIEPWDSSTPLETDEVELPLFREVELSAGSGSTSVQENHGAKLRFAKSTLARKGIDPSEAACCFVSGDSMHPVLPDGSTVGINTSDKLIRDGQMYAIDHQGMLRVKYLYRIPGGIRIKSANPDYEDEVIHPTSDSEFRILGRVFWYSVLL